MPLVCACFSKPSASELTKSNEMTDLHLRHENLIVIITSCALARAAKELLFEIAEYVSRRFPTVYTVTRHDPAKVESVYGWYGQGQIKDITVVPVGETYNLDECDPMTTAALLYVFALPSTSSCCCCVRRVWEAM